jgi:aspartyl-tRNA(Asn)/glutamyl-tRNA(Gln) amidotransferase subunit C
MSVTAKDVQHVARLAELAVEPEELAALTEQMDRIVGFVAQLAELGEPDPGASYVAGPERAALRPDEVRPPDLVRPPSALAPEFVDGFFVVPKLGAMEEP